MQRSLVWVVFVLLAGCSSTPSQETMHTEVEPKEDEGRSNSTAVGPRRADAFYLQNPDVLGLRAPGLRVLNFTNNATTRLSNALLTGTGNLVHWILLVPSQDLDNRTRGCAVTTGWRMKHYASGVDTLTNAPLLAGNWSLLVHAERLANLTLLFNTTSLSSYRATNGTLLGWPVQTLDADVRIESNGSPYRVTFNKTFHTSNRSWVIGHFGVRGDGFAQFRGISSKVEASTGFLCGQHRNEVAQPLTGAASWNSIVTIHLGEAGAYTYAGRFESTSAVGPHPSARAHVLFP